MKPKSLVEIFMATAELVAIFVSFAVVLGMVQNISLKQDQMFSLLEENCIPPRNDAQMLNGYNN